MAEKHYTELYSDLAGDAMNLIDALVLASYMRGVAEQDETDEDAFLTVEATISVYNMIGAAVREINAAYERLIETNGH